MDEAVAAAFPRLDVSEDDARKIAHGGRLAATGLGRGPIGVFGPDGTCWPWWRSTAPSPSPSPSSCPDGASRPAVGLAP